MYDYNVKRFKHAYIGSMETYYTILHVLMWHPLRCKFGGPCSGIAAHLPTRSKTVFFDILLFLGELVPCGHYFAMGPMRGRVSRGRSSEASPPWLCKACLPYNVFMMFAILNIKLETCWLRKWNIKMEFLKVPPLDPPFVRRGDAMNWSRQLCFQREAFMSWIMNMMNGRQHEKIWLAFGVFKIIVKHIFSCGCLMSSS